MLCTLDALDTSSAPFLHFQRTRQIEKETWIANYNLLSNANSALREILFVLQKKICQREAIFSANDFLHAPKIFASATKLQRFRRLALEAVKILSGEKILCSLTSIRHWVIKFRNIIPPFHSHRSLRKSSNKVSGKWRKRRWISNQDSAERGNIQYGWKRLRWRRILSWF